MRRAAITAAVATALAWVVLVPALAQAAEGDLDPSFGTGGKVTTSFAVDHDDQANAVAVQPGGKVVVAGVVNNGGSNTDFAVARYNADGSLDASFGTGGKAKTDLLGTGASDTANSVALDSQGRIVAGGYARVGGDDDFAVARYLPSGALDTTFNAVGTRPGVPGTATYDVTPFAGDTDRANAVAIDAQGRIVLAGSSDTGGGADFALARLAPDGSLDTSFGGGGTGTVTTPFSANTDQANALALQPDGKLVAAGSASNGDTSDFALARYNADGGLDTSFNATGKVTTPIGSASDAAKALALQPDGKLVAAGFAFNGSNFDFALARYNPDGSLDANFDFDGKTTTPIGSSQEEAHALTVQPDGKLVAAGFATNGAREFALVRYNANGSLDTSFDADGKVTTAFGIGDEANALALQPDGKLVAAGLATPGPTSLRDIALARYIGDQTPPGAPSIGSGPANGSYTNDPTPTFTFSSGEAGSTFSCGFGAGAAACSSPFTPSSLAEGAHTFSLTAIDRAGNASAATLRRFTVDTKKPELKIKGKAKVKTAGRKGRDKLKLKANEQVSFKCKVDRKKAKKCDAKYKTPKLKLGKHKVKVTAIDRAGNKASKTKKLKVVAA
jgi:uncharacterized delta-60 repeat protein